MTNVVESRKERAGGWGVAGGGGVVEEETFKFEARDEDGMSADESVAAGSEEVVVVDDGTDDV